MTTLHKAAQMALDALEWCEPAGTVGYGGVAIRSAAITALREAMAAPKPEPVAEVFDTFGNSQDPNKAVGHVWLKAHYFPPKGAKLYAAPPAAPAPDGWVMVPREPTEEMIQAAAGAWGESESGLHNAFAAALRGGIAAAPAASVVPQPAQRTADCLMCGHCAATGERVAKPAVPLTDEQIRSMWKSSEFRGNGGQVDWFCEGIRAAEAHHGITGGKP